MDIKSYKKHPKILISLIKSNGVSHHVNASKIIKDVKLLKFCLTLLAFVSLK